MNIKTKTIKNPREFPYQQYTGKVGPHKFEVNLFEDDSGYYEGKIGKDKICGGEDNLEEWLDEAEEMCSFYHNLVDFLEEVKYLRKQELSKKEKSKYAQS